MNKRIKDITGLKFGKLTVIEITDIKNNAGRFLWKCICDCGNKNYVFADSNNLQRHNTKSCGCLFYDRRKENVYNLSGDFGMGYCDKGFFYFDLDDYNKLKDYYWSINDQHYVYTHTPKNNLRATQRLHRLVMDLDSKSDIRIDHVNRNPLDNRKENLRIATKSQNNMNYPIRKNNTSGIIGVSWIPEREKWLAEITLNYKNFRLGGFVNIDDAIFARLKAEKEMFGEFAPQQHLFQKYNI